MKRKNVGIRFDSVTQLGRVKAAAKYLGRPWTAFVRESAVAAANKALADEIAERVLRTQEKSV